MSDETSIARNDYQYFERSVAGAFAIRHREREDFLIGVTESGIYLNSYHGNNPTGAEMRELVEVMRECVAAFDALQEGGA